MFYKWVGTEENLLECGFELINGFYFRDREIMITANKLVVGVGLGLTDEEFYTPSAAKDLIERGLVVEYKEKE